jgi:N-methylhydantoinase B
MTMTIKGGDVFRHKVAGAGGWGHPLERDPAAVVKDVRNELMSLQAAEDEYGVVIDLQTWTVDAIASQRLRAITRTAWLD